MHKLRRMSTQLSTTSQDCMLRLHLLVLITRPDHNLQDLRAKVFPIKGRKVKAPEVVVAVTLPVRRKERSLSSLVVSTPRVSAHATMTGRRTKSVVRKATSRGSGFSIEKHVKKEEDSAEDHPESSSSPENSKFSDNTRQVKEGNVLFGIISYIDDLLSYILKDNCFNLLMYCSSLTGAEFFSC